MDRWADIPIDELPCEVEWETPELKKAYLRWKADSATPPTVGEAANDTNVEPSMWAIFGREDSVYVAEVLNDMVPNLLMWALGLVSVLMNWRGAVEDVCLLSSWMRAEACLSFVSMADACMRCFCLLQVRVAGVIACALVHGWRLYPMAGPLLGVIIAIAGASVGNTVARTLAILSYAVLLDWLLTVTFELMPLGGFGTACAIYVSAYFSAKVTRRVSACLNFDSHVTYCRRLTCVLLAAIVMQHDGLMMGLFMVVLVETQFPVWLLPFPKRSLAKPDAAPCKAARLPSDEECVMNAMCGSAAGSPDVGAKRKKSVDAADTKRFHVKEAAQATPKEFQAIADETAAEIRHKFFSEAMPTTAEVSIRCPADIFLVFRDVLVRAM